MLNLKEKAVKLVIWDFQDTRLWWKDKRGWQGKARKGKERQEHHREYSAFRRGLCGATQPVWLGVRCLLWLHARAEQVRLWMLGGRRIGRRIWKLEEVKKHGFLGTLSVGCLSIRGFVPQPRNIKSRPKYLDNSIMVCCIGFYAELGQHTRWGKHTCSQQLTTLIRT